MTEKNIIVDYKFVCNYMIYQAAVKYLYEHGYTSEMIAGMFTIADVPTEYLEVPQEVIYQFIALDLMFRGDEE